MIKKNNALLKGAECCILFFFLSLSVTLTINKKKKIIQKQKGACTNDRMD